MIKRIIAILIAVILLFSLVGCGARKKVDQKIQEKVMEKTVDKITGDNVDIDTDKDKITIIALQLIPTQLRIAHHIACAPEQAPDTPRRVEIAYLQKNRIVIEDYNNTKNMLANLS